jgi:PAS domain S-box-containing protein
MTSVLYAHLRKEEVTISLIPTLKFIAVGVLWIILSDLAVFFSHSTTADHFPIFHLEIFKGILFVLAMGVFFYIIHRKNNKRNHEVAGLDLFRKNPQSMFIYSMESLTFLDVNDAAINTYGYSRSEFLAMTICQIRPAEDLDKLHRAVEQLQNGYRFIGRSRHLRKNGQMIHCEISAYSINYNGHHAGLIMANDLTNQLKTEEALKEALASNEKAINDKLYEVALFNKELQVRIREVNSNNDELIEVNKLLQHASRNAVARYDARMQRTQSVVTNWMDSITEAIWSFDLKDVNETFVSKGTLSVFGCEKSIVLDQPNFWQKYIHQNDKLRIAKEVMALEHLDCLTIKYCHVDGQRMISQEIALIRDEDERVVKLVCCAQVSAC